MSARVVVATPFCVLDHTPARMRWTYAWSTGKRLGSMLIQAVIVAALMLVPESSAATPLSITSACSASKAKAAANAFRCATRRHVLAMNTGEPLDLSTCESKLLSSFEKAELPGSCLVDGDASAAWASVASTAEEVLDILGAETATTDDEKACVTEQNTLVSWLVACRNKATRGLLLRGEVHPRVHANECYRVFGTRFLTTCPGASDATVIAIDLVAARAGAFLRSADLSVAAFQFQALLRGADMTGADLHGSAFSGADLTAAILVDSNLEGAGFSFHANLRDADLRNADATGSYFERTHLVGANLGGVDLSTATLVKIFSGRLSGCPAALPPMWSCDGDILTGPGVRVNEGDFDGADLHGRVLIDASLATTFRGADFSAADLTEAGFANADLSSANFTGANLTDLFFFYSDFDGANFRQANLENAQAQGSSFDGVLWDDTTCPDGTNSTANGGSCCGHLLGYPESCSP